MTKLQLAILATVFALVLYMYVANIVRERREDKELDRWIEERLTKGKSPGGDTDSRRGRR